MRVITASVVLVVLICGTAYVLNIYGSSADKESQTYVDRVMPEILRGWDSKILIDNASTEFLKVASKSLVQQSLSTVSTKLGPMKQYNGSAGEATFLFTSHGIKTVANYSAKVLFERGEALVIIRLVREDGKWRILFFDVRPTVP